MLALLLNAGAGSAFVGPAFSMVRRSSAHRAAPAVMMGPERITVDANGDIADEGFGVTKSTIELPSSTPPLKPPLTLDIDRKAEALVFQPAEGTPKGGVVFLHGFSQKPKNYETTLRSLAAAGFKVVAPTTWLFGVVWPWVSVDKAPRSPPGKLQTAIIVDGLRAMESLRQELPGAPVSLVGHSMGGACALVIPSLTTADITSVFAMSPAASASQVTTLNPYLSSSVSDYPKLFMAYASTPHLVLVSAEKDLIVPAKSVRDVYEKAAESKVPSALVELQTGSHIGFEDKVKVYLPKFLAVFFPAAWASVGILFNVIDFLVYRANALQGLLGNFDTQLSTSKVLVNRLNAAYSGGDLLADLIVFEEPVKDWGAESQLDTNDKGLKETLRDPLQGR